MSKKVIDKEKIARENLLKKGEEVSGKKIEGYDFDKGVNYEDIIKSFSGVGFQASNLFKAIEITNEMIKKCDKIFLGYTSNMVSSGNRDILRYLFKHKKIDIAVTTGGGFEEDIIKCMGDFVLGDFRADGKELRDKAVNRIGNIFVPNSRYLKFEDFVSKILEEMYLEQKENGKIWTPSEIIWKVGEKIDDERSMYYWAWKNKIKVYCPMILDGSFGDMVYFFKYKKGREDFIVDIANDTKELNDSTIGLDKSGVLVLGAGSVKHSILNAHLYRNGADYSVFINTSQEYDGSDAGALPEEALSWGKLRKDSKNVKVFGDATILFPILVAESFAKK